MTLKWAEMVAPRVRHLAFEHDEGTPLSFIPGQFINIHFETDGKELKRSYSLATIPGKSDFIEFAAGHFPGGPATELLFSIAPGTKITTSGPFGRLTLRDETPGRYIFLATSTGVTPFLSMLPELAKRMQDSDLHVILLEGVQRREDLLYGEIFTTFAKEHPQFTFRAHYSREETDDLHDFEHKGYVQNAFDDLQLDPEKDIIYLCGNPSMVDDAFNQLKERGFDAKSVRREKYISNAR